MFAAYRNDEESQEKPEFVPNPSFEDTSRALVRVISSDSSDSSDDSEDDQPKAIQYYRTKPQSTKVELYYFDKDPRIEYLKLESLPRRVLPMYRILRRYNFMIYGKRKKFKRYFKKKDKTSKKSLDEPENDEGQQMKVYLNKNPNDVEKWIEYINYKVSILCHFNLWIYFNPTINFKIKPSTKASICSSLFPGHNLNNSR